MWLLYYLPPTKEEVYAIAHDVCLSVCLSISKITQKCAHGFGWNFACRQVSGHGRTDQLLSPNHSPDAETGKSEIESRSNRHLTQSRLQVTGCTAERYCSLHVVVQGPGSYRGRINFLYDVRLLSYGASNFINFRISAYFLIHYEYTYCRGPTLQRHVVLEWFYSVTRPNNFVGGTCAPPSDLLVICLFPLRWYVWCDGVI